MKKFLFGFLVAVLLSVFFWKIKEQQSVSFTDTGVLQEKLQNVSKLVVTEGHFSDIITYKDAKEIFMNWFKAEKKAVVLVNAKATLTFDLKQMEYVLDEENKILLIKKIPAPQLDIYPKLEYYDLQADYLNEFTATDYNKIGDLVETRLRSKIQTSSMVTNATNRLLSELHNLLVQQGFNYTVQYQESSQVPLEDMLFYMEKR